MLTARTLARSTAAVAVAGVVSPSGSRASCAGSGSSSNSAMARPFSTSTSSAAAASRAARAAKRGPASARLVPTPSPKQRQQQSIAAVNKSLEPVQKMVARSLSSVSQVPQTMPNRAQIINAIRERTLLEQPNAFNERATRRERRLVIKAQRKDAKRRRKETSVAARLGVSTKESTPFVRKDRQFITYKPITPSIRWVRTPLNEHLHQGGPEPGLTIAKRSTGGRNHHGHVTVRGRGRGHKRRLRLVDFYRWEAGEQDVVRIEYDPGRSAHIALLKHGETGALSYILAPEGLRAGDKVQSYRSDHSIGQGGKAPRPEARTPVPPPPPPTIDPSAPQSVTAPAGGETETETPSSQASPTQTGQEAQPPARQQTALDLGIFRTRAIRPGNVLPLSLIPIGTTIHAISLHPGGPAKLCRSAGTSGQLIAFTARKQQQQQGSGADAASSETGSMGFGTDKSHAQVKLQSGEVRLVPVRCVAAVGRVSNPDHEHRRLGKAGRSRWLGRRPKVRGVAMNAVDHPHGGGRGKSKSNMHPRSKWGLLKFARTRKPGSRNGNQMVVRPRPRANGKRQGKA